MSEHIISPLTPSRASPVQAAPVMFLQRKCACGGAPGISGECEECQANLLQRKAVTASSLGAVPSSVSAALGAPGQPLHADTRKYMESRFGHDFSHVRIHADSGAADSARAVHALAYTVGRDVVFAPGQYAPNTAAGRQLLAHELTHVLQQSASSVSLQPRLELGAPNDQAESEADRIAARLTSAAAPTEQLRVSQAPARLRRQPAVQPRTETEGCEPTLQNDLKAMHQPALDHLDRAITSLEPEWKKMIPADKAAFTQYFDPSGSGEIDDGFVRDVRQKYRLIRGNMRSLRFDCDPSSRTLCGSSSKWCVGGRLMWTCFGNLHVCSAAYKTATPDSKIETIIHESVHNALLTTDRAYSNEAGFNKLSPRGSGFFGRILNFLGRIPVLGILFRLLPGNNDTINNPDSYAGYAMKV
ncbi:MAG TPA: DUF4157 domain-containing protein [Candidatus Saccharimonadales bacterium]|nr:DUF4157 domain-containing protein [Candidatus Saccharimonadales bacterium]